MYHKAQRWTDLSSMSNSSGRRLSLRSLHIRDCTTTAACVAAACDMRLEHLHLDRLYDHGDRYFLDEIIDSEAQTLEALELHSSPRR